MSTSKFVIVETEYGPVKGTRKSTILGMDYINFQGIPYMAAPVGKLRFRDAQPPQKWSEPLDASRELSYPALNMFTMEPEGEEDAGIVNVFTKNTESIRKLPVMVWIHGGAFQMGSSKTDLYGPDYFLQKDVVFVSLNYRLAAFGFMSLTDPSLGVPGNAGLKDQTFALKWVKRNIEHFGGDPENVTIFGESAGGGSVHYHMISELSRGLFKRAIPMSGTAFSTPWALQPRRNWAQRLATALGYNGSQAERDILEFLESADPYEMTKIFDKILTPDEKNAEKISCAFGPTIEPYRTENSFIPEHPMLMAREAWSNEIDCMIGGCTNEGLVMSMEFNLRHKYSTLDNLRNFPNYFAPFLETGLAIDDPKAVEFGKIIKKAYYGFTEPSKTNIDGYYYFVGDYYFWLGIYRALLSRAASNGRGKTFLYRFDVVTELNFFKKFVKAEDHPGAEHGADVGHLFRGSMLPATASINSVEFDNIKRCIAIWTNFAITGNPNCSELGDVEWQPLGSVESPMKCLELSANKCSFIDLPEMERLKVWVSIFEKAGIELY